MFLVFVSCCPVSRTFLALQSMSVVLPGELFQPTTSQPSESWKIVGYGISKTPSAQFVVSQPGILRSSGIKHWVSVQSRRLVFSVSESEDSIFHVRYVPERNDLVLGIVVGKMGDIFKVSSSDIFF